MFTDPFDEFRKMRNEMDKLFNSVFEKTSLRKDLINFKQPLSDIENKKNEVEVNLEMPGIDKKDIILTIKDNILEVKAEKKQELKKENKGFYQYERSYSGFYRRFMLPSDINTNATKSDYKNGILKITIPKKKEEKAKKVKKIMVQ